MSTSNASAASSRQAASTRGSTSRVTTAVWSPRWSWVSTMSAPNRFASAARIAAPSIVQSPLVPLGLGGDLVLELHEPVEDGLGTRRAARDVDVHRDDRVDALDGRVVVVEAAGARAHAEGDDPLRLGHLIVDALEDRRHLLADRPDDEQDVRLAGREPRQSGAEAIDVVVGTGHRHVLHAAARGDERVLEDRILARPADGLVELGREETAYSHSSPPLRQM